MNTSDLGRGLSADGRARKSSMRATLIEESRRVARLRRRRRDTLGALSAVIAVVAGVWIASLNPVRRSATPSGGGDARLAEKPDSTGSEEPVYRERGATIEVVRVAGGTGAIERSAALGDPSRYEIGDEELIDLLASVGRPTGIARVGGRVMLTAAVTDEELDAERRKKKNES